MENNEKQESNRALKLPNLRVARYSLGMTLEDLVEKSGVCKGSISNTERGISGMTAKNVAKLAEAMGYTVAQLASNDPGVLSCQTSQQSSTMKSAE